MLAYFPPSNITKQAADRQTYLQNLWNVDIMLVTSRWIWRPLAELTGSVGKVSVSSEKRATHSTHVVHIHTQDITVHTHTHRHRMTD